MEEKLQNIREQFISFKEMELQKSIKRSNVFAVVSGVVATLSSLVVAGNIVTGNGLEVLQVGGSTIAMTAYTICYSQMANLYKSELEKLQEKKNQPSDSIKDRLETLRYQLQQYNTLLSMNYLVSGGFYLSSLGHVIELLTMPDLPNVITSITGTALSALVATLYLFLSKSYKNVVNLKENEVDSLEKIEEQNMKYNQVTPEVVEQCGVLELSAPQQDSEQPMVLRKEETMKK